MRFYKKELPDVDEVVMCQVQQIAEMGAYVKLLEYGGCSIPVQLPGTGAY